MQLCVGWHQPCSHLTSLLCCPVVIFPRQKVNDMGGGNVRVAEIFSTPFNINRVTVEIRANTHAALPVSGILLVCVFQDVLPYIISEWSVSLAPRLRISGVVPLLPLDAFMTWTGASVVSVAPTSYVR